MKQITIYDLIPLLKKGWVAMDKDGTWVWYEGKPVIHEIEPMWKMQGPNWSFIDLERCFKSLAHFDGDWKDSLIKVEHKEEYKNDNR
jgi:hypothetical protein